MQNKYSPLISIIIPIYNREKTLHYCIDSILSQTYPRWELLLIDDGSSDSSATICEQYCNKDNRIHYFYQKNQGAGPARNLGIENAHGDWITFLDSDDAVTQNHLSQLACYGEGKDLVMVNHCIKEDKQGNGNLVKSRYYWEGIENMSIDGNESIINFLYGTLNPYKFYNYCCWDKFFNTAVIKNYNLRFPIDIPTGQDIYFVVNFFKYTERFFFCKEGTHISVPLGNEGIEHLACKLRHPNEFLYCHKRNFDALFALYEHSKCEKVRNYAINYFVEDTFRRAIIRYTHWRNRRILGRCEINKFIRDSFVPEIRQYEEYFRYIHDDIIRKHAYMVVSGKEGDVYDYWFIRNLIVDIKFAIKRRCL